MVEHGRRWLGAAMALVLVAGVGAALVFHAVQPAARRHQAVRPVSLARTGTAPTPAPPLDDSRLASNPAPDLGIHAESAVLVDLDSRRVLWEKDAHSLRPPASLTKLVTAMVVMDLAGSLEREVTVPVEATQVESDSTVMGLGAGETVSVRDLMYGIFLVSGNDAAETLARAFIDRAHFIDLMNEKAAALGMRGTHFSNPSGLDDPALRSTAYDLAVAAAAIVAAYPDLAGLSGVKDQVLPQTAGHPAYHLYSLIKLVYVYPGATGLKSGYTDDAGYCLAGTAVRGDRRLAVVILHSDTELTKDAGKLLDYGFSTPAASLPSVA
jgi:D-alanyl-D-alanine carboxypeptidase (penicillin-binding protein 5/6)